MGSYSIGKLAKATQVSVDTIRFYEKIGLLPPPVRGPSGYRRYFGDDVRRLRFVRSARNLGLSLTEISELVKIERAGEAATGAEFKPRFGKLHQRLMELQEWRKDVADWLRGTKLDSDQIASKFADLTESMLAPIAGERLDPQLCPGETGGCRCALPME